MNYLHIRLLENIVHCLVFKEHLTSQSQLVYFISLKRFCQALFSTFFNLFFKGFVFFF